MTAAFESNPRGDPLPADHTLEDRIATIRSTLNGVTALDSRIDRMSYLELETVETILRSTVLKERPLEALISNYLLVVDNIKQRDPQNEAGLNTAWHRLLLSYDRTDADLADVCHEYVETIVETKLDARKIAKVFDFAAAGIKRCSRIETVKKDAASLIDIEETYSEFPDVIAEVVRLHSKYEKIPLSKFRSTFELCHTIGERVKDVLKDCEKNERDLRALLESIDSFVGTYNREGHIGRGKFKDLLIKVLDSYDSKGNDPTAAIAAVARVGATYYGEVANSDLAPMFESGRGFGLVCPNFFDLLPIISEKKLWDQILKIGEAYESVYRQFYQADASVATTGLTKHIARVIALSPAFLPRIASMLETHPIDLGVLDNHFQELQIENLMPTLLFGRDPDEMEGAIRSFRHMTINDSTPYGDNDPMAQTVRDESFAIARRVWDLYSGFGSLAFEGMRRGEKPAALAEFGLDSASLVQGIRADDIEKPPGRGYLLSFLSKDNLFARNAKGARDPFASFKASMPWAANELDDIETAQYLFLRKGYGVIPPRLPKYELNSVHYSFITWNDHFSNSWCERAYLVPTVVLTELLQESLYKIDRFGSSDHKRVRDINSTGLTPSKLELLCREKDLPLLDVGSGSVLSGGMCNAFPVGSSPYHTWERDMSYNVTRDFWGHSHKAYINGGRYQPSRDADLDKLQTPLREAHEVVRDLTTRCLNLLSFFQLGNSFWRKGQTVPYKQEFSFDPTGGGGFGVSGDTSGRSSILRRNEKDDFVPTPYSNRMLIQAYDWHNVFSQRGANKQAFPVLGKAEALRYSVKPEQMLLDTHSLRIWDGRDWKQLPLWSNGEGAEEIDLWNEIIMSKLGPLEDIRWYKKELFSEKAA